MAIQVITGPHWSIRVGDVLDGLATLADRSMHCVVTSPPYFGLREYGFAGQIGQEATPELFVEKLLEVFAEVGRVLRDDGALFVNLGDSYTAGGRTSHGTRIGNKQGTNRASAAGVDMCRPNADIEQGNKIGIPWRFALAMQEAGWILRQDVVWSKPSCMPESISGSRWVRCRVKVEGCSAPNAGGVRGVNLVRGIGEAQGWTKETHPATRSPAKYTDCPGCDKCRENGGLVLRRGSWRPTTSHEYIFQFVKSQSYFCDGDGSKEACSGTTHSRGAGVNPKAASIELTSSRNGQPRQNPSHSSAVAGPVETRNMRSVWRITSEAYKEAHFACYPTELVRRCLIAATSRGGCCSACGAQYAPVVESKRSATRPGTDSKVGKRDAAIACGSRPGRPDHPNLVGNRDPQRHTTTTVVTGYLPTCKCGAEVARPRVLDPFGGSMTTGQVAINMGCEFIGLEGNADYAELGVKRLNTPWVPRSERKKPAKPKRRKQRLQKELF